MPLCHPENNACGLQLSAERKGELLPKVGRADRLLGVNPLTRQTFAKRGETGGGRALASASSQRWGRTNFLFLLQLINKLDLLHVSL